MSIIAQSLVNETVTVIVNTGTSIEHLFAKNDHPQWNDIVAAYKAKDEELLKTLISIKSAVEKYTVGLLSVTDAGVTFRGKPIHTVDGQRVMAFMRDGLPFEPIANYIEKKMANPSARAISEMYNFLEHKNMPLTPDGTFIAYKGVNPDYFSVMGNLTTVVLQGEVDKEGRIKNEIGKVIEVERSSVDDDYRNGCSFGLHAGSLAYAAGWGKRVIYVEINPADVVSVPDDCSCQKLRCCKYKVIGEYTGKLPETYTDEYSSKPVPDFYDEDEDDLDNDCCDSCGNPDSDCDCNEDEDEDDASLGDEMWTLGWSEGELAFKNKEDYDPQTSMTEHSLDSGDEFVVGSFLQGYEHGYHNAKKDMCDECKTTLPVNESESDKDEDSCDCSECREDRNQE